MTLPAGPRRRTTPSPELPAPGLAPTDVDPSQAPPALSVVHLVRRPVTAHGGVERVVDGLVRGMKASHPSWSVVSRSAFRSTRGLASRPVLADLLAAVRLAAVLRRSPEDVAFVHCPECLWVTSWLRRLTARRGRGEGPAVVAVWHGAGPRRFLALRPEHAWSARLLAAWISQVERGALVADAHVAVHTGVEDDLRRHVGWSGHVRVIPNTLDPTLADDLRVQAAERVIEPEGPLRVLWVGQTAYAKGLDVALAAHELARREGTEVRLLVAGVPAPADAGRRDGVEWLGVVAPAEIPDVYRRADVLLFPSRYESFGLVVIEAMAAGLPVVVSTGVPRDIVVDGRNGVVVDGHDVSPYAAALARLAGDAALRGRMSAANRVDVTRFDAARGALAFAEVASEVAADRPARTHRS